jgi:hypothetical protein
MHGGEPKDHEVCAVNETRQMKSYALAHPSRYVALWLAEGSRAAEALRAGGVTEIIVTAPGPAEATVSAFLEGKLTRQAESFCACHH